MCFDDVLNKFSFLFEDNGLEQDLAKVKQNIEVMADREEYANICLNYLKDNISKMAPVTLLTNVGLLIIVENLGKKYERKINQYEIDFLMSLVLKFGKINSTYSRSCGPKEISLLLKAIIIYLTCVEHKLHKENSNAFSINLWYRIGRIEGFDNDKLQLINEFCEKYDKEVSGSKVKLKNVIKILRIYDETLAKRLEKISGKVIYLEQQYDFFVFDKDNIKNICNKNELNYDETIRLLEMFSCKIGDLRYIEENEIYLNNPIYDKFIIKITERHFFIPNINIVIENIFELLKKIVAEEKEKLVIYSNCRAKFLEEKTYALIINMFKNYGQIYRNSEWDYKDKHGENDCILVYENYAIIFENKSGEINRNTTKGIMGRAYSDSKKLIYDPTEQALLFSELVEANYGNKLVLKVKGGGENVIDLKYVNKNIRIGIILEESILQNIRMDGKRHCPILSIFQLNKIAKCLKREEIIDYFIKRTFIEKNTFYNATEYDLLYTYLVNGINTSNKIYQEMSKKERIFFQYKEGEITRKDLIREAWFQTLIDKYMKTEDKYKLEKVISLLEIPPIVQNQIWRDIRIKKRLELIDTLSYRKKLIIVRLLDYLNNNTYIEIDQDILYFEKLIKYESKLNNILYIAITSDLKEVVVELSMNGKRF